jgi:hypothetical protein
MRLRYAHYPALRPLLPFAAHLFLLLKHLADYRQIPQFFPA